MAFWACWARKGYSAAAFLALRETKGKNSRLPKDLKKLSSSRLSRSLWQVSSTERAAAL